MTQNDFIPDSLTPLTLQNILQDPNETFFFHIPDNNGQVHPHYTLLVWLLGNLRPEKIAILDPENKNHISQSLYEISHSLELDSYYFCNTINQQHSIF